MQGVSGSSFRGDIALDDLVLIDGNCPSDLPFECDFDDENMCGFTNDPAEKHQWIRNKGKEKRSRFSFEKNLLRSGQTPGVFDGPSIDHSTLTDSGYYMYVVTASTTREGEKARLVSPWMNNTDGQCISFWYHSSGSEVGSLTVYKRLLSTDELYPLWKIKQNFGDIWNAAEISIEKTNEPWAIAFEGEYTLGYAGEVAIDDVFIRNGYCPTLGSCSFESVDFCTWHNIPSPADDFDWLTAHGETDTGFTGPSVDHTFGDKFGYYALVESWAPRQPNDRAILESTILTPTSSIGSCFSFWYHMLGNNGGLNIYIKDVKATQPLWIW